MTPELFVRFPDAAAAAAVESRAVEPYVRSTGVCRNKAEQITAASRLLVEHHFGHRTALQERAGAPACRAWPARPPAWCWPGAQASTAGVTVDTHVSRLSQRLELSRKSEPRTIEPDLMRLVPQAQWQDLSIRLIFHGRAVCTARKPRCLDCSIA